MLTFGEHKIYKFFKGYENIKMILNKLKLPATFPYSKYGAMPDPKVSIYNIFGN